MAMGLLMFNGCWESLALVLLSPSFLVMRLAELNPLFWLSAFEPFEAFEYLRCWLLLLLERAGGLYNLVVFILLESAMPTVMLAGTLPFLLGLKLCWLSAGEFLLLPNLVGGL